VLIRSPFLSHCEPKQKLDAAGADDGLLLVWRQEPFHEGIATSRCRSIITVSTAPPPISW